MYNFLCHYSYHAYFILFHKSEKHVTEKNKRLSLLSLFINQGSQFLIPADRIIENDLCQIPIFCQMERVWIVFCSLLYCPNTVKYCDLDKVSKMCRINFILPKVKKMSINFQLLKDIKKTSLKIYISPVMLELEISNMGSR